MHYTCDLIDRSPINGYYCSKCPLNITGNTELYLCSGIYPGENIRNKTEYRYLELICFIDYLEKKNEINT
jgi:hypothetical protein